MLLRFTASAAGLLAGLLAATPATAVHHHTKNFQRIASFPVFLNTDVEQETVAERARRPAARLHR